MKANSFDNSLKILRFLNLKDQGAKILSKEQELEAFKKRAVKIACFLVQNGASLFLRNKKRQSCIALCNQDHYLVKLLRKIHQENFRLVS